MYTLKNHKTQILLVLPYTHNDMSGMSLNQKYSIFGYIITFFGKYMYQNKKYYKLFYTYTFLKKSDHV